jgi:hypothetical protein
VAAGRLEHVQRAEDVDARVGARILDAAPDADLGRVVADDLRAHVGEDLVELRVAHVDAVQPRAAVDVLDRAGGEVVHDGHLVTGGQIGVDDSR